MSPSATPPAEAPSSCLGLCLHPSCSAELDIAFEDIVARPQRVLQQLADRLGLQVGAALLKFSLRCAVLCSVVQ